MRHCKHCNTDKGDEDFYPKKVSICKMCFIRRQKEYYSANIESRRAYQREYVKDRWKQSEKEARRAERVKQAVPKWYGEFDSLFYSEARDLIKRYRLLGHEFHLDHIVPIKGRNVCGLHYHKNWQLLPAEENLRKSNQYYQE